VVNVSDQNDGGGGFKKLHQYRFPDRSSIRTLNPVRSKGSPGDGICKYLSSILCYKYAFVCCFGLY